MVNINDKEAERIIERIRNSPPPMRLWGWWWRTPASQRPSIKTVIDIHGPRLPVVEVKVAQETIDFGAVMTEDLPDGLLPANATNQK